MGAAYLKGPDAAKQRGTWVCGGKARFETPALANAVVERDRRHKERGDKRYGVRKAYHCGYCGGWHLGTESAVLASVTNKARAELIVREK